MHLLSPQYDPIMESLTPFYALPHEEVQKRLQEAEQLPETFTLIVKSGGNGKVVLQWNDEYSRDTWWNTRPRADAQINLMEYFLDRLGDMRYVCNKPSLHNAEHSETDCSSVLSAGSLSLSTTSRESSSPMSAAQS